MKLSNVLTTAGLLLVLGAIGVGQTFAGSQKEKSNKQSVEKYKYVFVTGSRIPQKVKVKSVGTLTTSPLRTYKRSEIDQMGRFTTERVLAQDPSVQINGVGGAGPGN